MLKWKRPTEPQRLWSGIIAIFWRVHHSNAETKLCFWLATSVIYSYRHRLKTTNFCAAINGWRILLKSNRLTAEIYENEHPSPMSDGPSLLTVSEVWIDLTAPPEMAEKQTRRFAEYFDVSTGDGESVRVSLRHSYRHLPKENWCFSWWSLEVSARTYRPVWSTFLVIHQ